VIETPKVDWLALSPTLALLGASGVALLASVLVPAWMRKATGAVVAFAGFVVAAIFAGFVIAETSTPRVLLEESMTRDELAGVAQLILAVTGAVVVFASWSEQRRDNHGEYYALLTAAAAGMVFFVGAGNLMTLFLGLAWFSLLLYILCALDTYRATSVEAGL
jgi:NADH-quinone oxidoreductase subunit N